jgi:chaperonin GroEL
MKKQIVFNKEARQKLQKGVDTLANAVKVTLGPKGRNVIVGDYFSNSHITKDGVTVAKTIFCDDPIENIGAQTVKRVAAKTADEAGDGTTSSSVVAQEILNLGLEAVDKGHNPMDIKRGMDKAVISVVDKLKEISRPIENNNQIKQVAVISANNDEEIGGVVAEAMEVVENTGVITVAESDTLETYVKKTDGYEINQGFISPYFITDERKNESVLNNPLIAISDYDITNFRNIQNIVGSLYQSVQQTGDKRDLLIICDKMEGEAFGTLVQNHRSNPLEIKICVVQAPYVGSNRLAALEDIAIMTGGTVFSEKKGLNIKDGTLEQLGSCKKAIISNNKTVLIEGNGDKDAIKERLETLNEAYETIEKSRNKDILKERRDKMSMKQAIIHIGATTKLEMEEKKDRYDDAICATRSAVEEGVVPGGGTALIRCMNAVDNVIYNNSDEQVGGNIIRNAILSPLRTIIYNAGYISDYADERFQKEYVDKIIESHNNTFGFNAKTNKFEDLIESGVIDPTKVVRNTIENSSSIASLLITTECVVADLSSLDR